MREKNGKKKSHGKMEAFIETDCSPEHSESGDGASQSSPSKTKKPRSHSNKKKAFRTDDIQIIIDN